MNQTSDPKASLEASLEELQRMIEAAPDEPAFDADNEHIPMPTTQTVPELDTRTGFPPRYLDPWTRPVDDGWNSKLGALAEKILSGGICALIGPRGTGKTRLAAEAARDTNRMTARYTTAMELFLRLRRSFQKDAPEKEFDIVDRLASCHLLVIDEIQERGDTPWEDRILTHIIDKRYGRGIPTVVIANLTASALAENLGESIVSRLHEVGGIIELTGPSHRIQNHDHQR